MRKTLFFFALLFLALICVYSLAVMPFSLQKTGEPDDVCLQFWHVDSFEGGTGSRRAYLQRLSKSFCADLLKKSGARVTVDVKQLTPLAQNELFKKGIYPDVISFGAGVQVPYERLVKLDFTAGEVGVYNGEPYAAVWAQGGYVCVTRPENGDISGYIICEQALANPLLALKLSKTLADAEIITLPAKDGVYEFYRKKGYALVGTQRDLYRLDGKLPIVVEPLSGYNDLYCCVCVLRSGTVGESSGSVGANVSGGVGGSAASDGSDGGGSGAKNEYDGKKVKTALALARYITLSEKACPSEVGFLNYKGEAQNISAPISPLNGYSPKFGLSVFTAEGQVAELKRLSENLDENGQIVKNMLKRLK